MVRGAEGGGHEDIVTLEVSGREEREGGVERVPRGSQLAKGSTMGAVREGFMRRVFGIDVRSFRFVGGRGS
eukprot:1208-Amorphochlora_amoeboformis.AAC.1